MISSPSVGALSTQFLAVSGHPPHQERIDLAGHLIKIAWKSEHSFYSITKLNQIAKRKKRILWTNRGKPRRKKTPKLSELRGFQSSSLGRAISIIDKMSLAFQTDSFTPHYFEVPERKTLTLAWPDDSDSGTMQSYDITKVKKHAQDQWHSIAMLFGIGMSFIENGVCPKCQSNFQLSDEAGAGNCEKCGKFADGIELIQWWKGLTREDAKNQIGGKIILETIKPSDDNELIKPISFPELEMDYPDLRPELIKGVLRRGEVINVIAPPKTGKSYLVGNLAWAVATGSNWLSYDTVKSRVLIIDNELHRETLVHRIQKIADEKKIDLSIRSGVEVISLRGRNMAIDDFASRLDVAPGEYGLVVVDALYRTLPQGMSENDNAAMMAVYNQLDLMAEMWQTSIVVVHHSSKGAQGDKAITDIGAGAGSISRAADTHIAIREHESPGNYVLEAVTRSFKSPEPVTIKFDFPLWYATTLEAKVKRTKQKAADQQDSDKKAKAELLEAIPKSGDIQQSMLVDSVCWGKDRVKRIAGLLMKDGLVAKSEKKDGVFYSLTECKNEKD